MTEVTCAIIVEAGRVLATQRSAHMPHALKWEFPGGKVKEGETPESCIIREIHEELGLKIQVDRLLPEVKYSYDTHTIKLIPFICTPGKGNITLAEHKAYRWVPFTELEEVDWLDADVEVVKVLLAWYSFPD